MSYPTFLGTRATLKPTDRGGGRTGVEHVVPGFLMTCQEETNWCWAAVTQAVERIGGDAVDQADVATDHIAASRPDENCAVFDPDDADEADCGAHACEAQCNAPAQR